MAERRSLLPWMVAVRARSLAELADRLEAPGCKALHASSRRLRLGFVFNGQGAQWHAMGRELIATYPVFSMGIQEAGKVLKEYGAAWSLYDELMRDEQTTRVSDVNISQPISVAVQLCLVDLLKSWNIIPSAFTSHSSGEMAATYTVGALFFKQALGVAYFRGELALNNVSSLAGGMLAAAISSETAERYIANVPSGGVVVACINSPNSTTLSGDLAAIDEVESLLKKDGLFARKLKVPMAYHSSHMSHMAQEYAERLRDILPGDNTWTGALFTSPVTGGIVTSPKAFTPEHWVHNLTSPVLFSQAFESMCFSPTASSIQGSNVDIIVEIGAHSTLAGPIRQILESRNVKMPYTSCLKRSVNAVETMQDLKQTFVHDLPSYQWNHTVPYWVEPRISKEMKNKRFPPHELLGALLAGTNGLTPTWRNFIRLSDIEWLRDHQVDSKVVFPGAGYVAMAIEAVRLLIDPSKKTIHGYRLRDIDIVNALVIPESSAGVETQLCLRRFSEKELDHKGWYEFELCSLGISGSWAENCRGYITAETGDAIKAATTYEAERPCEDSYLPAGAAVTNIITEELFASLRETGIYHGPNFQNLIDSHAAGDRAKTNLAIASVATETHDYVLHPTTLDSILQATYSSLPKDMGRDSMALPRSIRTLFVPRSLRRQGGEKLQVFSELVRSDKRGFTSNVMVTNRDSDDTEPFLGMQDFFGQAVPRETDDPSPIAGICFKSSWELDILHNVPTSVKNSMKIALDEDEAELERKLVRVSYHFIHDTVNEFEGEDTENWPWHHKRFYEWMKSVVALGKRGELGSGSQKWSQARKGLKTMLADELNAGDVSGQLTVRVGQKLTSIIRGDVTPLELMMEGNLLNQFYMNHQRFKTRSAKHLAKIAELYAVKQPGANVLEIGRGTGGATGTVLDAFAARGDGSGTLLGHYTFTDISPGFFEAAKHKFATWSSMMEFKKLDIEADSIEQSFTAGSYDLIVASMVLHATKNLHKALSHVRKLLKPGGKLLMAETTRDRLDAQLIFGTLPGWWLAEEPDRQMSPNAPLETWDRVLRETGFNIGDYSEEELESASIILSSATETVATVTGPVTIVYEKTTTTVQPWLSQLAEEIRVQRGISPSIESLDEVQCQDKICIFVADMEDPFVTGMDEEAFEKLRSLLLNCRGVLWLSCGDIIECEQPSFAPTQCLLRSLRHGESSKGFIHLDFERGPDGPWTSDNINHIVLVLQRSFDGSIEMSSIDWEYAVTDSMLHVPRLFPDKTHDAVVSDNEVDPAPQMQPFHQPNRPLVWETPSSGIGGKVEIESKAFGLNFREVMVALGQLDEPLVGYECAGIVTKLGPNTEQSGLRVGDRVCALCNGNRISSKGQVSWLGVAKIPDDMSWEQAASIPVAYVTAYSSLISIARLQKGESVLIHAATGGTGQAAVVLAQHIGAKVFATCSTAAKRDLLIEKYNIDPEHIFSSRDSSFGPGVMAKTNGRGVDVVLNSLSGPLLKATWDCIARFGRFVDIAKVDIEAARRLDTTPFRRCASYVSFDIIQLCEYNGQLTQETLLACLRICEERGTQPIWPIIPYSISDMDKALRQMQGGTHMGKLVLIPGNGDLVKVVTRPRPFSLCNPNATYLIVGGVTGICRAITEWMMTEKGAQNLLIISRHATSHKYAAQLKVTAKDTGCNLQIRDCDASDELSLVELLAEASRSMPPVRGVVNGAMVLDVGHYIRAHDF
ncbi:hypothetical protein VE02_08865 [Pseudogymnoascus sp. 03VT05]|nr:hypothetical protein VE02_08865 [Pseudogymnoascus sp. 03VT05]